MPAANSDPATKPQLPRVVLLTSPSLYGAAIMNIVGRHPGLNVVGVGLTARVYKGKGPLATARTFAQRTGWPYTSFNILVGDVSWSMLRATGRPRGVADFRKRVRPVKDINSPETLAWLKELQPDYIASYYFNQWIGADVRAIAAKGCVNLHPSLLPALRGPDPIFRALERNLATTGLTLHKIDDGFDTGQILHQEVRAVPPGTSVMGFYLQQAKDGATILADWLAGDLSASGPTSVAATGEPGDYSTFPTPAEVRAFRNAGKRLYSTGEWLRALRQID